MADIVSGDIVNTIKENINLLKTEIELIKIQGAHIAGIVDSERGTVARMGADLRKEIDKLEANFDNIMYNPKDGMLVTIDRLVQESNNRKMVRQNIIALWIAVIGTLIWRIIDWIIQKK